jgi:hypothetical protein
VGLTIDESARLVGAHRWFELRLFEVLGGWVGSTPEPEAKLMLDRHSQHHAWRAQQWWDRLPVLADVDRPALVVADAPALTAATEALAGAQGTTLRLAGLYRVLLPRLCGRYRQHRSLAAQVSDGSIIRTLDIVTGDVEADWREGELLLQQLLTDSNSVRAAADGVAELESLLL